MTLIRHCEPVGRGNLSTLLCGFFLRHAILPEIAASLALLAMTHQGHCEPVGCGNLSTLLCGFFLRYAILTEIAASLRSSQ